MSSFKTDNFTFLDYTEMDDVMSRRVWECRNLSEIRKWMVNSQNIPFEEHMKYVKSLRREDNTLYFSVLTGGDFIGSVNLHIKENGIAERGIYINPDQWGKGLGRKICKEFYKYIRDNLGVYTVTTTVRKCNHSSNALEHCLGATRTGEDAEYYYYMTCLVDM